MEVATEMRCFNMRKQQEPGQLLTRAFIVMLTAKLRTGPHGPSAARPVEVEPRQEEGELFKRRRMEELPVHLWKKRSLATLTYAQLTAKLRTGPHGASVARPAEVEPGRGREKLFKSQRMEELPVGIWRRKNLARLSHVKAPQTPTRTTATILQPH